MAARRSIPIALKVDLIIIISLVVGIGAGIAVLAIRQYTAAIDSTDDALRRQAQIIYFSIKNLMLPGDAPVARQFLADMQQNAGLNTAISLYRRTGAEAFVDNETIRTVIQGREMLTHALGKMGFLVYPSQANFILVKPPMAASELFEKLLRRGIIIRPCRGSVIMSA